MDAFLGEIRIFAGNFAPKGWALCDGSLLPIRQFTALFSLLGVTYGGDGKVTFALPNLQGQAAMHWGAGAGLTPRSLGERGGEASHTLRMEEIPNHTHVPNAVNGTAANSTTPIGAVWSNVSGRGSYNVYGTALDTTVNPAAVGAVGGSGAHNNRQPYLALSYIIAMEGIFPPRP
ncbi:tail fiber protein [Cohnella lubricantis]|uniref:Phage tail protein n=1 Tax=Cohnella lubricantis TaxID=2163172 RepID=A0A841TDB0_9BACL|nr:tail fiber protein [Cohnella lubricantis]MBB6678186.1 phage tail protein [Cohnella lubricantis]MBP2119687.1 microcystin-dependent protein [Cohnella lubricantis]